MTVKQILIAIFAVLVGGQLLPLSHGARMALFVALVIFAAVVLIGGGVGYMMNLLD